MEFKVIRKDDECLMHYGIQGQKWYVRRFQNEDGSLTQAGKERYGRSEHRPATSEHGKVKAHKIKTDGNVVNGFAVKYYSSHVGVLDSHNHASVALQEKVSNEVSKENIELQNKCTDLLAYIKKHGLPQEIKNSKFYSDSFDREISRLNNLPSDVNNMHLNTKVKSQQIAIKTYYNNLNVIAEKIKKRLEILDKERH